MWWNDVFVKKHVSGNFFRGGSKIRSRRGDPYSRYPYPLSYYCFFRRRTIYVVGHSFKKPLYIRTYKGGFWFLYLIMIIPYVNLPIFNVSRENVRTAYVQHTYSIRIFSKNWNSILIEKNYTYICITFPKILFFIPIYIGN